MSSMLIPDKTADLRRTAEKTYSNELDKLRDKSYEGRGGTESDRNALKHFSDNKVSLVYEIFIGELRKSAPSEYSKELNRLRKARDKAKNNKHIEKHKVLEAQHWYLKNNKQEFFTKFVKENMDRYTNHDNNAQGDSKPAAVGRPPTYPRQDSNRSIFSTERDCQNPQAGSSPVASAPHTPRRSPAAPFSPVQGAARAGSPFGFQGQPAASYASPGQHTGEVPFGIHGHPATPPPHAPPGHPPAGLAYGSHAFPGYPATPPHAPPAGHPPGGSPYGIPAFPGYQAASPHAPPGQPHSGGPPFLFQGQPAASPHASPGHHQGGSPFGTPGTPPVYLPPVAAMTPEQQIKLAEQQIKLEETRLKIVQTEKDKAAFGVAEWTAKGLDSHSKAMDSHAKAMDSSAKAFEENAKFAYDIYTNCGKEDDKRKRSADQQEAPSQDQLQPQSFALDGWAIERNDKSFHGFLENLIGHLEQNSERVVSPATKKLILRALAYLLFACGEDNFDAFYGSFPHHQRKEFFENLIQQCKWPGGDTICRFIKEHYIQKFHQDMHVLFRKFITPRDGTTELVKARIVQVGGVGTFQIRLEGKDREEASSIERIEPLGDADIDEFVRIPVFSFNFHEWFSKEDLVDAFLVYAKDNKSNPNLVKVACLRLLSFLYSFFYEAQKGSNGLDGFLSAYKRTEELLMIMGSWSWCPPKKVGNENGTVGDFVLAYIEKFKKGMQVNYWKGSIKHTAVITQCEQSAEGKGSFHVQYQDIGGLHDPSTTIDRIAPFAENIDQFVNFQS